MRKNISKFLGLAFVAVIASVFVLACSKPAKVLTIGATPVPHAELLNLVKDDLAKEGITLTVKEFTDYVTPNTALAEKQLDANFFQHQPYLDSFNAEHKTDLVSAGGIHIEPLGLYSQKIKAIADLKDGSTIGIPNDPTNEGRALLLLQAKGLIKLDATAGLTATPKNVTENTKKLVFKELDAAQLPRVLPDVDAAIINGNFALAANLNPTKDALLLEDSKSPYVNIIAVRKGDETKPEIVALVKALQTQKVKDFIAQKYNGGVVATF